MSESLRPKHMPIGGRAQLVYLSRLSVQKTKEIKPDPTWSGEKFQSQVFQPLRPNCPHGSNPLGLLIGQV